MKQSRGLGFLIIALTYLLATAAGVGVFFVFPALSLWLKVLLADIAATIVVYIVSLITDNASVYDPYWSVQPMVIVPLIMWASGNFSPVAIFLLVFVEIWGVRLTANWAYTFKNLGEQDWRYDNIRKQTGAAYPLVSFIGIQMMPTLIVFVCQMPVIALMGADSVMNGWTVIGMVIMGIGILLETFADLTKHSFRANGGAGIVKNGLWKKGRHPNYLGEILFWWGVYAVVLAAAPVLWWTFFGALANTLLFLFVSIPLAEKQSALRHEADWEDYKSNSRLFI